MKSRFLYLLLLVSLGLFILHIPYIFNGFTWLDHRDIESRNAVVALSQLPQIFVTPFGQTGFYRPLVTVFHSIDYALYRDFAPGYHLTNILLHIMVSIAAGFFISSIFSITRRELLFCIILIGIHPLGWLPAGSISYRPELLVTLFILLTVFFHTKARASNNPLFALAAVLCFFLGLLAKETAIVVIPLLILFCELTKKQKKRKGFWMTLFIPEILILGLYISVRTLVVPQVWNVQQYPLSWDEAIGTRIHAFMELLVQFVIPFKPPLSDAVPISGLVSLPVVILLLLCIVGGYTILKQGHYAQLSRVILLFAIMLLPALAVIPVPRLGSPHYGYIPLAAFASFIVILVRKGNKSHRKVTVALVCVWLLCMTYTTVAGGFQFKNDQTLFAPEVAKDKQFYEGYFYLGNYYFSQREYAKAELAYKNAIVKDEGVIAYHERTAAYINFALMKYEQGKIIDSIRLLKNARQMGDPKYRKTIDVLIKRLNY